MHPILLIAGLSILVTLLNAIKPLYIDDTYYYYLARQIASNPLKPLGGEIFWFQWPRLATGGAMPLVLPYWFSAAVRLFGERPMLWKLWMFPFVFSFVGGVYLLVKRFSGSMKDVLTCMIVLSPAFLPSWNIMLDMPALSLTIAGIAIFTVASEKRSLSLAIISGLLAGLAIQTKYTGLAAPGAIFLYAFIFRRWFLGFVAVAAASLVFGSLELMVFVMHGHWQFASLMNRGFVVSRWDNVRMLKSLLMTVGATNICAALLMLVGFKVYRWLVALAIVLVGGGFVWLAFGSIEPVLFGTFGGFLALSILAGLLCLLLLRGHGEKPVKFLGFNRDGVFLLLWLILEIAAYFFISPFGAVRRVLGVVIVTMIIAVSLSGFWRTSRIGLILTGAVAGLGIVLGLGYYALDLHEARVPMRSVADADEWIRNKDPDARIWYAGHWGFAYYADRAAMVPIVPDHSLLRAGDWFVIPDRVERQSFDDTDIPGEVAHTLSYDDDLRLQTMFCYYSGKAPLEHREKARLNVYICRATSDFVPRTNWDPLTVNWGQYGRMLTWAKYSTPYVSRSLQDGDWRVRLKMAELLGGLGSAAKALGPELERCLDDEDPRVRQAATKSLKLLE